MRTLIGALLLGFLLPLSANAQLGPLEKAVLRIEAGGSYTSFDKSSFASFGRLSQSGQPSFTVGIYAGLPLLEDLRGEAGLRYVRIAHKVVTNHSGVERPTSEETALLSSKHVLSPLGLRYQVLGGPVHVAAHAGPNLQFVSHRSWNLDYEDPSLQDDAGNRTSRKLHLGAVLSGGVGVSIPVVGQQFTLDAKYAHLLGTDPFPYRREMSLNVGIVF